MKLWIGADHRGKEYKQMIKDILRRKGHDVQDAGTCRDGPSDYPDYAGPVAKAVRDGDADRGVLICGSGIGMSIMANRFKGVRATLCLTPEMAESARRHNNSNILCLAQDQIDEEEAKAILETWLDTEFEGGRHIRRLEKLDREGC